MFQYGDYNDADTNTWPWRRYKDLWLGAVQSILKMCRSLSLQISTSLFITVFKTAWHQALHWIRYTQSSHSHPKPLRYILIYVQDSNVFSSPSCFLTKTLWAPLSLSRLLHTAFVSHLPWSNHSKGKRWWTDTPPCPIPRHSSEGREKHR